jgi:hypothetical protein
MRCLDVGMRHWDSRHVLAALLLDRRGEVLRDNSHWEPNHDVCWPWLMKSLYLVACHLRVFQLRCTKSGIQRYECEIEVPYEIFGSMIPACGHREIFLFEESSSIVPRAE